MCEHLGELQQPKTTTENLTSGLVSCDISKTSCFRLGEDQHFPTRRTIRPIHVSLYTHACLGASLEETLQLLEYQIIFMELTRQVGEPEP